MAHFPRWIENNSADSTALEQEIFRALLARYEGTTIYPEAVQELPGYPPGDSSSDHEHEGGTHQVGRSKSCHSDEDYVQTLRRQENYAMAHNDEDCVQTRRRPAPATGLALPLYDNDEDHNHNPDFEHEEVPQWALDQWERETRERQEGVASSATGGGASAATGDGAATGGGNGACGTLTPPSDTDQAALDAARADNDKWEWGSRVQWWQRDKEWIE